jgi:hypothetical protein
MLAFEHSHRQQFFNPYSNFEANIENPYPGLDMNIYNNIEQSTDFSALPFSFYENPTLFIEAPLDNFKYGMHRSASSNGSVKQASQHSSELLPSLLSSASQPSVHSASSSTVGSPYSGHSHPISHHDSWASNQGLGLTPTIVNHESYTHEFVSTDPDPELAFATHDKFSGNFVSESTDLSSCHKRSSTFPVAVTQSLSLPPNAPFSTSPEPLSIDSFLELSNKSPISAQSFSHPPATPVENGNLSKKSNPTFKSPTTPASAHSRRPSAVSPSLSRPSAAQSAPQTSLAVPAPAAGPQPFHNVAAPVPQHANQFQSHFFAQSSGNFIPPLESSCSFLLALFPTSCLLLS